MAPPKRLDYSLVLLKKGRDEGRTVRAVRRVNDISETDAGSLLGLRLPLTVAPDLSYHDALLGQFEFVCCDAIAVFLASEVAAGAERSYLTGLFAKLRRSDEFRNVTLRLERVPDNEEGGRFLDQFLGLVGAEARIRSFPVDLPVLYKKARIMTHWADRIGATAHVTGDPQTE